ncbi:unannotated protein [freshwater metagenome]|uniref:Unannotated protein n=1 Tax=freshwater metagenome TaxID=449393 RepID=A0A6J6TFA8_9ZZZZ
MAYSFLAARTLYLLHFDQQGHDFTQLHQVIGIRAAPGGALGAG